MVDIKIIEQGNRITAVTEVFKDALMLSNKTYFLEQVNKQKNEKKAAKKELVVIREKYKLMEASMKELQEELIRYKNGRKSPERSSSVKNLREAEPIKANPKQMPKLMKSMVVKSGPGLAK